jgi:hypothetical protein
METNFQDIQLKLEDYKASYQKVQSALEKNSEKIQDESIRHQREKDLRKLLEDIEKAISYHQDLLKLSKEQVETYFSGFKLQVSDVGRKCNLYYENDKKWYPGEINSVNIQDQTADVTFLGFSERYTVPCSFIQLLIPPKQSDLKEGLEVEALLQDGKWHYCSIESIEPDTVTVRLARWGHKNTLPYDSIRFITEDKKPLLERDTFVIPDKLKVLPNDPENIRLKKKKKIKALRKAWRTAQIEKETKFYTSGWKEFQKKNVIKKESIFKSPETFSGKVGVANSGQKMTITKSKIAQESDI